MHTYLPAAEPYITNVPIAIAGVGYDTGNNATSKGMYVPCYGFTAGQGYSIVGGCTSYPAAPFPYLQQTGSPRR